MIDNKHISSEKTNLISEIQRLQHSINRSIGHHASADWMGLSLTIAQLKSLFFIDSETNANSRKLANVLGVTPPNVTGIIDRLVEHGLVSREENPEDRRILLLSTTNTAKSLLVKLRESGAIRMSGVLAQMSLDELSALIEGLNVLATASDKYREIHNNEFNGS
ncbi:MarR family winged helix-turn-helix transcriptional regulator [Chloroflexota bacterium]